MGDFIHHYTDIDTLALILKHRTIRFNRLDNVDDLTETTSFIKLNLAEFFFISCWTYDTNESIPLWNMYTKNMAGVRMSLPRDFFKYSPLVMPKHYQQYQNGNINSPVPFDKMFTNKYMILPNFIDPRHFSREVIYSKDYQTKKNNSINVNVSTQGIFDCKIKDPTGIAAYKSPDWEFQKEYRYVLFIFPSLPLPPSGPFSKQFADTIPNFIAQKLHKGEGPPIEYIDIDIDKDILNNIHITTGPLCTEGDILIVESLLSKYTSSGILKRSKLEGTIRRL